MKAGLKFLFFCFCILNILTLNAQEDKLKDLVRLNKEYDLRKSIQMQVIYQGYSNYYTNDPVDTQYGVVKKQGENVYQQIGKIESLHTKNFNLIVDQESKQINILKILASSDTPDLNDLLDEITNHLKDYKGITQTKLDNTLKEYKIKIEGLSDYSEIRIVYDTKTWIIKKITLYFNEAVSVNEGGKKEKPRLVITYKQTDLKPLFSKNEFQLEKFVKKENNRYVGDGKYLGYKVISQL